MFPCPYLTYYLSTPAWPWVQIPTHRYGVLYSNPEEYKSADAGALTHTTANPK